MQQIIGEKKLLKEEGLTHLQQLLSKNYVRALHRLHIGFHVWTWLFPFIKFIVDCSLKITLPSANKSVIFKRFYFPFTRPRNFENHWKCCIINYKWSEICSIQRRMLTILGVQQFLQHILWHQYIPDVWQNKHATFNMHRVCIFVEFMVRIWAMHGFTVSHHLKPHECR